MDNILLPIALFIMVFFSAFFSATETAYTTVSKIELQKLKRKNVKVYKWLGKQFKGFGSVLATILIANNAVNIGLTALATYFLTQFFASADAALISAAAITPIIVIFGEITPKMLARRHAVSYLKKVVFLMQLLIWFFYPLTFWIRKAVISNQTTVTEEELHSLISIAGDEEVLERDEANLAKRSLGFDSTMVKSIMVRKMSIEFVKSSDSYEEVINKFTQTGFSRLPVKEGEEYLGYYYIKQLIRCKDKKPLEIIHPFVTISEKDTLTAALAQMKTKRSQLLFVAKRPNQITGIITTEDVLEMLVGKIYDESELTSEIREISLNELVVTSRTRFIEVERFFYNVDFWNDNRPIVRHLMVKDWVNKVLKIKKRSIGTKFEYKNIEIEIIDKAKLGLKYKFRIK